MGVFSTFPKSKPRGCCQFQSRVQAFNSFLANFTFISDFDHLFPLHANQIQICQFSHLSKNKLLTELILMLSLFISPLLHCSPPHSSVLFCISSHYIPPQILSTLLISLHFLPYRDIFFFYVLFDSKFVLLFSLSTSCCF